jgi:VWFA-related protein
MPARALALAVACCLVASADAGQQKPPTAPPDQVTTFRTATSLVEVDIIVKDRDGRFVSGLTADDFEVLEEGKPQAIQHFYLVTENPTSPGELRPDVVLPRSPDQTGRRVWVLVFDSEHLSSTLLARVKQAAMDFVNDQVRPGDLTGIFVNGALWRGRLSNNRQELLDGIRSASPGFETPATRLGSLIEFPRVTSEYEATRIDAGDQRVLDEMTDKACIEEPQACSLVGGRENIQDQIGLKAQTYVRDARRAARTTVDSLGYITRNLSRLEGRKTVVLLSEGFFVDDLRSALPQIAGQAARAGITIYAVNVRGTLGVAGRILADASIPRGSLSTQGDSSEEGLDVLAAETGGVSIRHTDNFAHALDSIAQDTSTYYVLAYSPANTNLDGKFRRIELRTKWQGLEVRARRGYLATPLPTPKSIRTKPGSLP